MAYITQDQKKEIATLLKNVVPKGWKYSLAINNHSTLVMTIRSAPVDLLSEWFRCSYQVLRKTSSKRSGSLANL